MLCAPLNMFRPSMAAVPSLPCPDGFRLRSARAGDEDNWVRIEVAAREFPDVPSARSRCLENYGPFGEGMADACYFIETEQGLAVGTATAFSGTFCGEVRGRVAWVGMIPEHQGRGLSKPLVSAVMTHLARQQYATAFLNTQTTSWRAIGLYLTFGFEPILVRAECLAGWRAVEEALRRPLVTDRTRRCDGGVIVAP